MKTPEGHQLERSAEQFAKSDSVQTARYFAEHAVNHTLEQGYLFDVPEEIKGDLEEAGLNVYKQKKAPFMNF